MLPKEPPSPPVTGEAALIRLLGEGVTWGDSAEWLQVLPEASVDLWFTSPPYADARAYSRIHPDHYVEWFLPFSKYMLAATTDTGWLVVNIKNRVASSGALRGQRHPYVYQLVLALQEQGWRWLETYIWSKPNAVPGRFGPRTKDSFEYVYAFAKDTNLTLTWTLCACRTRRRWMRSSGASWTDWAAGTRRRASGATAPRPTFMVAPTQAMWSLSRRPTTSTAEPAGTPQQCLRAWPSSSSRRARRLAGW